MIFGKNYGDQICTLKRREELVSLVLNLTQSIENEQPNTTLDSSYIYGVDEDGQKYIVLPIDSDFDISIIGREDDLVNYSVSEYSALAGDYTRNINYFNIDISGIIPSQCTIFAD